MEESEEKPLQNLNALNIGIVQDNITTLDLSHRNIKNICKSVKLPTNLAELNISHNKLENIPETVMNLKSLALLDISYNNIQYFDDTPSFCHNIENLNISNNKLRAPPAWIWFESPEKLSKLDISCNIDITNCFQQGYFEEIIQCKTSIKDIKIYNCGLRNFKQFLGTFPEAKSLEAGTNEISYLSANSFTDIPCEGLVNCCDITRLNLSFTLVFNINPHIDIYKNLIEINLSQNEISSLPNEFCNLECLEVCILSFNRILYLPEDIIKLKKLITLCIDSNVLCVLPDNIWSLPNLKKVDLYDNHLYDVPVDIKQIQEIDMAQNYLEEPVDENYLTKKERLRHNIVGRLNGRKYENNKPESSHSSRTSDDESYDELHFDSYTKNDNSANGDRPSSPEDWDSDDYWVPHYFKTVTPPQSPWLYFVKRKMEEGNFCPMDMHMVSIAEKVKYEKLCNPQIQYESDGQFDDYSDDDS
ncbi:unnamed protein product [Parnassius mnemosyne]|uniref:Leucine rich repeat protein n=1 Tax=Parnassius mnemosyne TaxID=213953 RepID=A0AAV1LK84_9NEOP